jgi:uridylate kinase
MNCDALLKGTQVDGVYSSDPKTDKNAERYDQLSYQEVLTKNLRVMDTSAIALARENSVPILVFSIHNPGAFADVVNGKGTFTTISDNKS